MDRKDLRPFRPFNHNVLLAGKEREYDRMKEINENMSRIVLCDWAANVESIGTSPTKIAHQLAILSLIYDDVLIQDEIFALSNQMAQIFTPGREFEILKQCFEIGSIKVLKHKAYLSDDLKEMSQ